jgi:hypothetical protein
MSMSFLKDDCYQTVNMYCFCIEFHFDGRRRGFHAGQLIEYTLEPNPDAEEDKEAPPEKLSFAFSTADVVVLGWVLGRLADCLRENNSPPSASYPNAMPTSTRLKPSSRSSKLRQLKRCEGVWPFPLGAAC